MTPIAAVALIEHDGAVLLIRRPQRLDDPWSGQWALPGGRCEPEDLDLLHTARRELHEETGLDLPATAGWTAHGTQIAGLHRSQGVLVAPFHVRLTEPPALTLNSREVAAIHWLPLATLTDRALHLSGPMPGGGDRSWPFLPIGDVPLWGFTYRVLTAWQSTLGQ